MVKKITIILIIMLLVSINTHAYGNTRIEIFDIEKGCVIKSLESNFLIQNEVHNYLKDITGIYGKFSPIPKKGFMIKIFLEPPVAIQNAFLNSIVDEVILIFPKNESPFLMVFEVKKRPSFYRYESSTDKLMKLLDPYNKDL